MFKILILLPLVIQIQASTYSSSLTDCYKFAALFDNTCTSTSTSYSSVSAIPTKTVTCSTMVGECAGTTSGSYCSWSRALCVTCSSVSGTVYIRV